jgi:SAM-dependent methyltransferase
VKRTEAAGLTGRVTFAFADYHDLGGPPASYDCWWCQEALLYATDRVRVFSEARRVVRPGGRIVFTDLTLSRKLPETERSKFAADIRAPHLWDMAEYDRLLATMKFPILERQDWTPHVTATFGAVAQNLTSMRASFAFAIGEEAIHATEHRIQRQLDMARSGHLGWCFYVLEA